MSSDVMKCGACQRSGKISSRSEMPQNNFQVRRIVDFGNGVITIYPDLEFFGDDSDKSDDLGDDWEVILEGIDFGDIPQLDGIDVPPYVCNMGKSSRNKKKPCGNYTITNSDEGPSLSVRKPLTREEMTRKELEKICMKEF
ncbi:hypothetical protein Tco_0406955 [Tanacetum coccineum]